MPKDDSKPVRYIVLGVILSNKESLEDEISGLRFKANSVECIMESFSIRFFNSSSGTLRRYLDSIFYTISE